jgi:hypothetical protein
VAAAASPEVDLFGGLTFGGGGGGEALAAPPAALAHDPFDLSSLVAASPLPPPSASPAQATAFDFMGSRLGGPAPAPAVLQPQRQPPPLQAYGQPTMGGYPQRQQQQQQFGMGVPQQPPVGLDAAALYQQNLFLMQQMQHNQMLMQQQQQQQQHMGQPGGMLLQQPPRSLVQLQGGAVMISPLRPSAPAMAVPGGSAFDFMGTGGSLSSGGGSGGGAGSKSSSGASSKGAQEDAFSFVKDSMRAK